MPSQQSTSQKRHWLDTRNRHLHPPPPPPPNNTLCNCKSLNYEPISLTLAEYKLVMLWSKCGCPFTSYFVVLFSHSISATDVWSCLVLRLTFFLPIFIFYGGWNGLIGLVPLLPLLGLVYYYFLLARPLGLISFSFLFLFFFFFFRPFQLFVSAVTYQFLIIFLFHFLLGFPTVRPF